MILSIDTSCSLKNLPQPMAQKFLVDFEVKFTDYINACLAKGDKVMVVVNETKCDFNHLGSFDGFEYALNRMSRYYAAVMKQIILVHWDEVANYYWDEDDLYCSECGTLENVPRGFMDREVKMKLSQEMGKLKVVYEVVG